MQKEKIELQILLDMLGQQIYDNRYISVLNQALGSPLNLATGDWIFKRKRKKVKWMQYVFLTKKKGMQEVLHSEEG